MRTFEKSDKLHGVCYDVRGPVLDEAKEMERRGETVLHLNIGNPAPFGFRAPQIVLDSMEEALADPMSDTVIQRDFWKRVKKFYNIIWKKDFRDFPWIIFISEMVSVR